MMRNLILGCKRTIFLLILAIGPLGLIAQKLPLDSLLREFSKLDTLTAEKAYNRISSELDSLENWSALQVFSDSIYRQSVISNDTVLMYESLYGWSSALYERNDSTLADSIDEVADVLKAIYGFKLDDDKTSVNNRYNYISIMNSLLIFADSSNALGVEEAFNTYKRGEFYPQYHGGEMDHEVTYWVAMRVRGHDDKDEESLFSLGLDQISWDTAYFYFPRIQPDSTVGFDSLFTGLKVHNDDKTAAKDWRTFFYLDMPKGATKTFLTKIPSAVEDFQPKRVRFTYHEPDFLTVIEVSFYRDLGIFIAILVVQLFYFLLLYLSSREKIYPPYLLYIFGVLLFAATAYWYNDLFPLDPNNYWFFYLGGFLIAGLGLLAFTLRYLNAKELLPKSYKITKGFMYGFAIPPLSLMLLQALNFVPSLRLENLPESLLSTLNAIAQVLVMITLMSTTASLIMTIILGIQAWRQGYEPAKPFLVGMVILILFIGLTPVIAVGATWLFFEGLTFERVILAAEVGIVLQMIVFALGVGQKIKLLEKENKRALEEKLNAQEKANDRLRQTDKMKDEFLANTSHELRTPLNGILGLSEAIHDGVTGPIYPETRKNLEMVISSARRLSSLVSDLLDFSKLKNFEIHLQKKPLDIRSLSHVVLQVSESLLGEKDIELAMDIENGLPAVSADENRLQQILYNLVGNAIKFTEEGAVIIKARQEGDKIKVAVEDTGIGIAEDKQEGIFRSFEQGDGSTERKYGGTGLGLSITRQLVELHGGSISVHSEVGRGSTFRFDLPISTEEAQELSSAEVSVPTFDKSQFKGIQTAFALPEEELMERVEETAKTTYKILVVDDEPINRMVLKNHLSKGPYEITSAEDGVEALEIIETSEKGFDLILLDVMMPKMSGYEVCQKLRETYLPSELPIIMITAKNQVSDLVTGLTTGANDYIVKPFSKQELLARIKTHIDLLTINAATSRFVPYEFLRSLGKDNITEVHLGDQVSRTGTVLFSDIRGYTSLAEDMSPEQTFAFLNAYLGRMGPVIQEHGGFVNQFYGDGIMALFLDESDKALKASVNMIQTLRDYNDERHDKHRQALRIGIGLHMGSLMMGMIGDDKRLDTGLVADTVNTSSRVEGLTKHYGVDILISGAIYDQLSSPEEFHLRYLGKVQAKGKEETLDLYECFDGGEEEEIKLKKESLATFKEGISCYQSGKFTEAVAAFSKVLAANPADKPAKLFWEKAQSYGNQEPSEHWTGIEVL
ncbi:MAG: response regulator [Bacteroidota bacterium]